MIVPNSERTTLNESTTLTYPSLYGWDQINLDDAEIDVRVQIQSLIRDVPSPWETLELISPLVEIKVMDVLQQEVDDASSPSGYRAACVKSLRALSKARNIVPSSFSCQNVAKEGTNPICGGGFADIWKGRLHDTQVCLKVLRLFIPEKAREKLLRDFCQEALVWRQLRHPNILPFLGVNEYLFAPSYSLISPWMINGNIMFYLEAHPYHDRLTSLIQIAEGMKYLHNHDPPVVHADIRGANILVMDDLCCCLADFGLSLFAESRALTSSSWMGNGCIRWLAPEYMDSKLFNQSYLTARDVYAYGCTVVEIFTGEPPFSNIKNDAGVIHEVLIKQSRPPRPPRKIFPDDGLWELVMACLSTMSTQRPDVGKISEILTQLHTPANTDHWQWGPFDVLNDSTINPLPPMPFIIEELSAPSESAVVVNIDDEFFVPWQDGTVLPRAIFPSDGNPDQGASPDINAPDGFSINPDNVIPPYLVGSPSTPATSTATPTRQSHSANQTTPSSGKRRRSSSF